MSPSVREPGSQFVAFLELRARFVAILLLTGAAVYFHEPIRARVGRWFDRPTAVPLANAPDVEWYCPMDEAVVRSEPASCPLCGMPLSRRTRGVDAPLPADVVARISLTPGQIQLGGIRTTIVASKRLERSVRFIGELAVHPSHRVSVAAKVRSRVESVTVAAPGRTVKKGDELLTVYSPELINAQQVYLQLCHSRASLAAGAGTPGELPMTARERPLQLGLSKIDLDELERTSEVKLALPLRAPCDGVVARADARSGEYVDEGDVLFEIVDLSTLWIEFGVPPREAAELRSGQEIAVRIADEVGNRVTIIDSIAPVLDATTRTHRVVATLENPGERLRPGALVDVEIRSDVVEGSTANGDGSPILTVPLTAIVPSAAGPLVYREVREGRFEAVAIELGPRVAEEVAVIRGLAVGDRVVSAGAFLLDAEATWHGRRASSPASPAREDAK